MRRDPPRLRSARSTVFAAAAALGGLGVLGSGVPVAGQSVGLRGWAGTTVQAVEMRPVAALDGGCVPGTPCYLPLDEQLSVIGTQDISLTAWGFGVRGLSATAYLRGRAGLGSDFAWPRSEDHFDALLGYAQLIRGGWTARVGRQEVRSGLGFASFDGGNVQWRFADYELEGYAGRSLARGLREPENKALAGIEDFVPDVGVWLFGGAARAHFGLATATLRYQRELLADRSGLASERASFDGSATYSRVRLTGGIDWDFGRQLAGKGHLTAAAPLGGGRWMLSASAQRYVPYFSMSTIWGFFEPVEYHELMARVGWSPSTVFGLWASGGWRKYGDTQTTIVLRALEDTGRRAEGGGAWSFAPAWTLNGRYQLEWGPGGFLNSGDASVRWIASERMSVSVSGMSFQQIEQYRLGDGRAWGGGVSFDAELTRRITFVGGGAVIRHSRDNDGIESPWNQARAWSTLRVTLGGEAGRANRMRR